MLYGKKKKKSPRARPLVNDLRVKPTAAAAAAAAARELGAARVDVDGCAGAAARSPARQGEVPAACAVAARVMWADFFSSPPPPPPPLAVYLGRGGERLEQPVWPRPAVCLPIGVFGFFFFPLSNPIGLLHEKRGVFLISSLPHAS